MSRAPPTRAFFIRRLRAYSTTTIPVEYNLIEGVERPGDYRSGGYHSIHIDDRLRDRYRIVHNLGHGTYSTSWLATDEETSEHVAVKVCTADADRTEVEILRKITQRLKLSENSEEKMSLLPRVLDHFDLDGPNGTHPCLVTPPARCNLRDAVEVSGSGLLSLDVARSLAAQLVVALPMVHSQGYVHGDLHFDNILLQLPSSLNKLSVQELYARYGKPQKESITYLGTQTVVTNLGVPSYAMHRVWLGMPSNEMKLNDAKLILGNFGVSFRPDDKSRFESFTPLVLRPPEARFEPSKPLTLASDIWSLGCVMFELLAHRSLIDGSFLASQDDITAQQVELQGICRRSGGRGGRNDRSGMMTMERRLSRPEIIWPWERRFERWAQDPGRAKGMDAVGMEQRDAVLDLLKTMLAWKPSGRPDIMTIMESEWMTKWALPAYEESLGEQ